MSLGELLVLAGWVTLMVVGAASVAAGLILVIGFLSAAISLWRHWREDGHD